MKQMMIGLMAGWLLALPSAVMAGDFTVTTTDDAGGTTCTASVCSLRAAIAASNETSDSDTITLADAGTIELNAPLPAISGELTILGPGADELLIEGSSAFELTDGSLTITDVYLSGEGPLITARAGSVTLAGLSIDARSGAAIALDEGATLLSSDCAFLQGLEQAIAGSRTSLTLVDTEFAGAARAQASRGQTKGVRRDALLRELLDDDCTLNPHAGGLASSMVLLGLVVGAMFFIERRRRGRSA